MECGERVLICGSRYWTDEAPIRQLLTENQQSISLVIHGGARGADSIASRIASELKLPQSIHPPDWEKYGKRAGILRNIEMLYTMRPTRVVAYTDDLSTSKGTAHMVRIAQKEKIPVIIYSHGKFVELN